ncbi:HDR115Cp [Eremothecium sinecaudum]|uniref:HDR115Cp n=1 Tax=Eremothecium sinecaudum TaxID=45286 RepID=A0A0X8HST3_9SACH|nr:HDR115Cp [Eremothecium sinecaudum]AMD20857.1 HDR115Cp [Eremothecium sinecaudum]
MSVVSAGEGHGAINNHGQRRSAYQTDGKPLSKEALYRTQLKYGVYPTPANSVGLGLANSKSGSGAAATAAISNNKTNRKDQKVYMDRGASSAATRAHQEVPRSFDLLPKDSKPERKGSKKGRLGNMDISKVLSGAERAATKRLDERLNPEKPNYTYGLKTEGDYTRPNHYTLTSDHIGSLGARDNTNGQLEKDVDPAHYADFASSAALANRDHMPGKEFQRDVIEQHALSSDYYKGIDSRKVLALAQQRAQTRLKEIERDNPHTELFGNTEYNRAAVEIAKKHHQERQRLTGGKVNLGGGLWINADEVDHIAQEYVSPVLHDVDRRAVEQRAIDADIRQRSLTYNQKYAEWSKLQEEKLANDERLQREAHERHQLELSDVEQTFEGKHDELVYEKEQIIRKKQAELEKAQAAYEELARETEHIVATEQEAAQRELEEVKQAKASEIETLKAKRIETLEPLEDELEESRRHEEELIQERYRAQEELGISSHHLESDRAECAELEQKVAESNLKLQEQQEEVLALTSAEAELEKEITALSAMVEDAEQQVLQTSKALTEKEMELETLLSERKAELDKVELKLQQEKAVLAVTNDNLVHLRQGQLLPEQKFPDIMSENYTVQDSADTGIHSAAQSGAKPTVRISEQQQTAVHSGATTSEQQQQSSYQRQNPSGLSAKSARPESNVMNREQRTSGKPMRSDSGNVHYMTNSRSQKKSSPLGKFINKIMPKKKSDPSSKSSKRLQNSRGVNTSGSKHTLRPVSSSSNAQQTMPASNAHAVPSSSYNNPVHGSSSLRPQSSNQPIVGGSQRARAATDDVEIDDVQEILEPGAKKKKESLFTEVF